MRRYPAVHYVLVDDKLRILTAVKKAWGSRVTTVFPRQGQFGRDQKIFAEYPAADITIERIGDLLGYELSALLESQQTHIPHADRSFNESRSFMQRDVRRPLA